MPERIQQYYETTILPYLQNPYFVGGVIGIAVVVLVAFLIIRSRMRAMRIFKTHAGRVHVSRTALRDLVHSACRHVNTANRPRVSFFAKHGKLNLAVKLKLNEGQRLTDVSAQLQSRIAETLHETLSMEKVGRIDVIITGIRRDKSAKAIVADEPSEPIDEPVPVKEEESHFISTEDDFYEEHDTSKMTKDEELTLSETPFTEDAKADAPEVKPKRGFFGFGNRKSESKSADEEDELVLDDVPEPDNEAVNDKAENEKKV